jgi:heat shock protein HtpX
MRQLTGSTKVWLFLLFITLMLLILGYQLGGRLGLFLGFVVSIVFHSLIFFFGDSQLLGFLGAKQVHGADPWGLQEQLKKYALLLQIPTPSLYIVDSDAAYAFSLGHNWQKGSLCLSTGLLKRLKPKELEAVIAHQACHIQRLDTFGFGVAHVVAFALVGLGRILDQLWIIRIVSKKQAQKIFSNLTSPIAWFILKLAVSDKVYFQNDDMAAALLHDRKSLAEALWKVEGLSQTQPLQLPPCSSHFFIVNPLGLTEKNWFLLAHPKIETRIRRLVGYFPI